VPEGSPGALPRHRCQDINKFTLDLLKTFNFATSRLSSDHKADLSLINSAVTSRVCEFDEASCTEHGFVMEDLDITQVGKLPALDYYRR
jgi:hypothetical protein